MRTSKLKLKKLNNARDLGGLKTECGKQIKRGLLIRSGKLYNLPEKTLEYFKSAGVSTVIDLRIDTEVSEYPDTVIEGAEYIRLPLLCTATAGITRDKKMVSTMNRESKRIKEEFGNADEYIKETYRRILVGEDTRRVLKQFFEILLNAEGCVIWHCSGGKDRAGICAMLLEGLLGVGEQDIIADFTASQRSQRNKHFWQKIALYVVPVPRRLRAILLAMMNAKRQYITFALGFIKENFGGIEEYCKTALGLPEAQIEQLKEKYLE